MYNEKCENKYNLNHLIFFYKKLRFKSVIDLNRSTIGHFLSPNQPRQSSVGGKKGRNKEKDDIK